ncbi:phosphotransferase [Nakamurella sp. YIM 132087]|uniref:Phosphotransferase n=1 Tax=Nakamurella alba TaxID=2665158 RepID=A0A7K1FWR2_9ACTN|nr:phosphotransferase [Nakamurella alba]
MSTRPAVTDRVQAALADLHPGAEVSELAVLEGGRSGLTYAVDAGGHGYVVKAVPEGRRAVGRNDVLRQAVALRALHGRGVPVPTVAAESADPPAWFAMTRAAGESVEPVLDTQTVDPELVPVRMSALARAMRVMHGIDVTALDLGDQEVLAPADELARWTRTLRAVPEELRPQGEELVALLAAAPPAAARSALTHGDCRLGNSLFDGPSLTAIIDWEIWAVGDPRIDLAWFLLFCEPDNFPGVGHAAAGVPSEAQMIDVYSENGPPVEDLDWFRALARLKMAAIMGHNVKRHREGTHVDPVQETLPPTVAAMLRNGVRLLS